MLHYDRIVIEVEICVHGSVCAGSLLNASARSNQLPGDCACNKRPKSAPSGRSCKTWGIRVSEDREKKKRYVRISGL
jgi:hypothetical protein